MRTMKRVIPERLTVEEAAAQTGRRPDTLRRWIAAGAVTVEREGHRVAIPSEALDKLTGPRICLHCGDTFTPKRPRRVPLYCSARCARLANNAARRTRLAAARAAQAPAPKKSPVSASTAHLAAAVALARRLRPKD